MKHKRIIITSIFITALIAVIIARLAANKQSFANELKMVSEFNNIVPVIVDTVKYGQTTSEFSENGIFEANHETTIIAETQGKVVVISAKNGENVRAGQILAITDNELSKSQLELAKVNLEQAEKDRKRFEELSKGDAATTQQFEMAKQSFANAQSAYVLAKTQYENSFVKAPFNGIITKQYIEKGSYLLPGMQVYDVLEINKLKFIVKLTDDKLDRVKKGQKVKIVVDAYPGINFEGFIRSIIVKADLAKRYELEIDFENKQNEQVKPGMFGKALFNNAGNGQFLVIPRKAIAGSIKDPDVYVVRGDSVILKSISAVSIDDKNVEVRQGLEFGDVVVISGQINLVDGSKVTVIR